MYMKREFVEFRPDKVKTPAGETTDTVVIIDKSSGEIAFKGDPRQTREWLEGQESKERDKTGPEIETVEKVKGGTVIPGMVDTHEHPFLYASLANMVDLSEAGKLSELIDQVKKAGSDKSPDPLVCGYWHTEVISRLSKQDLDEAVPDRPVIVYDTSFHGAVVNTEMAKMLKSAISPEEDILGEFNIKTGRITEGFTIKAFEVISPPAEIIEGRVEKTFEEYFSNGITGVHDMAVNSWSELMAFLQMRKKWKNKEFSFPVARTFLMAPMLEKLFKSQRELEQAGLWDDKLLPTLGLKFITDGSLGSRTARLSEQYLDKETRGQWVVRVKEMNRVIEFALKHGIDQVAFHAIGDAAIKRVVRLAQQWGKKGQDLVGKDVDLARWRIEHFEMPTPETMQDVKDLGMWVSMQPNFLTDYIYRDRLGDRVKWICPHRKALGYKIPMMFGTDGMPMETLFGLWAATHALEEDQRLNFEEAMMAFSITPGKYTGEKRGLLEPGEKADIAVVDTDDFEQIIGGTQPQTVQDFADIQKGIQTKLRTDLPVLGTYVAGRKVYEKK
ncbi:amidohydrolase family protein [Patescibacteria group bacterium]|nr:amidohydrolase family protein [Patescibacteria group bacterium]